MTTFGVLFALAVIVLALYVICRGADEMLKPEAPPPKEVPRVGPQRQRPVVRRPRRPACECEKCLGYWER